MFASILSFLFLLISSTFCEAYLSRSVIPSHLQRHSSLQRQLSISSYSLDGSDPDRPSKVNQDSLFHQELENGSIAFGVMDGHGLQGHRLTRFLSLAFPSILNNCMATNYQPTIQLQEYQQLLITIGKDTDSANYTHFLCQAFHLAHFSAMQHPNVPAGQSGTTCLVGVLTGTQLEMCHVGDSRAILLRNDNSVIIPLTVESNIKQMPLELQRIQQGEGRIDSMGNIFYGPQGIAMTRSLGNAVMLRAGILPTPIINSPIQLSQGSTIVLATDGVWDVLSNEEVRDIVMRTDNFENAGRVLAEAAQQKWIGDLPIEGKVDDITCLIIQI